MSDIYGISAFGLKDCAALPSQGCRLEDFFLADAILPKNALGLIRTGKEAKRERVHSGLSWPPEARVEPGKPLRRVPIALAWSLLVNAGDQPIRWKAAEGVSVSLPTILTAHIKGVLKKNEFRFDNEDRAVIAIPDHLDEYAQEGLLRSLGNGGERFSLVWRTVAAAMTWLDKVRLADVASTDWMLVVYLGPDGMEFTPFGLRAVSQDQRDFVVPVRSRPRMDPGPSGMDWACALAEKIAPRLAEDPGAFWQVFTAFPEIWSAISQVQWNDYDLPRTWSTSEGWRYWNPSAEIRDEIWKCPVAPSRLLDALVRGSCRFETQRRSSSAQNWSRHLEAALKAVISPRRGSLRGMVVCGPLASNKPPPWLRRELVGLPMKEDPHPNSVWLAGSCEDPIATGARLYGERLRDRLPTYRDTLPGLTLYTQKGWELHWEGLVEAKECPGGIDYTNEIKDKFYLQGGHDRVSVYLRKETREEESSDPIKPTTTINEPWRISIENSINRMNSLEDATFCSDWKHSEKARTYFLEYALWHFSKKSRSISPYRHGEVVFPSVPNTDQPLSVIVRMRPASGLAKVDFLPTNKAFLRGRAVSFDYSRMRTIEEEDLPTLSLGWPEDLHIETTPNPSAFQDFRFAHFANQPFPMSQYMDRLEAMKNALNAPLQDKLKKIDENGEAGSIAGKKIVADIKRRIEEGEAQYLRCFPPTEGTKKFIVRATWLWGETPDKTCKYLERYFETYKGSLDCKYWNVLTESSSRGFTSQRQYSLLFNSIWNRSNRARLPIQSLGAVARILTYRKDACEGLTEEMAYQFIDCSIDIVQNEVRKGKVQRLFFQGALLFLSLLKFRIKDQTFMSHTEGKCKQRFDRMEFYLRTANNIAGESPQAERIMELINGVIDFMYFKGKSGLIGVLDTAAGG